MALSIRELPGQFPRRALGRRQREIDHALADPRRNAIPIPARRRRAGLEPVRAFLLIAAIPSVESRPRDLDLAQRAPRRQVRLFNQADRLASLRRRHSEASLSESTAVTLFLSSRFSSTVSATSCFRWAFSFRSSATSVDVASRV